MSKKKKYKMQATEELMISAFFASWLASLISWFTLPLYSDYGFNQSTKLGEILFMLLTSWFVVPLGIFVRFLHSLGQPVTSPDTLETFKMIGVYLIVFGIALAAIEKPWRKK